MSRQRELSPRRQHQMVVPVSLHQRLLRLSQLNQHLPEHIQEYESRFQRSLNIFCLFYLNILTTLALNLTLKIVEVYHLQVQLVKLAQLLDLVDCLYCLLIDLYKAGWY